MLHVAAAFPSTVVIWLIAMAGIFAGLSSLGWGLIVGRKALLLSGLACLTMLPLMFTVLARGQHWLSNRADWLGLGFALLSLSLVALPKLLGSLANEFSLRRLRPSLQNLAKHFRGEFLIEYPRVTFTNGGKQVVVAPLTIDRERNKLYLEIAAPWPDKQFRLEIYPAGIFSRLKDLLGMEDVPIGFTEFDRAFVVSSNSPKQAVQLLRLYVRDRLETLRQEDRDFCFSITAGHFVLKTKITNTQGPMIRLTEDFLDVYRAAIGFLKEEQTATELVSAPETVTYLEAPVGPTCQICGGIISGAHVECHSCRTPHHLDCWEYLGACSTYACGNTTYRRRQSL